MSKLSEDDFFRNIKTVSRFEKLELKNSTFDSRKKLMSKLGQYGLIKTYEFLRKNSSDHDSLKEKLLSLSGVHEQCGH